MNAGAWQGRHLGERTVSYEERDAILYALAVGATATDLDLVFEEHLQVLPTFALTQAQWAPDALGSLGAFDPTTAVHGSQRLQVHQPLPRAGQLAMAARVAAVWDKGRAAVFDIEVTSAYFTATWSLFAPGLGGFGGERGPAQPRRRERPADRELHVDTTTNQAALYRLLGDWHPMHISPAAARAAGMDRPFLHGLCTLATTTLPLAAAVGAHPADLVDLEGRFASPVFPGDQLRVAVWEAGAGVRFDVARGDETVISGGRAQFRAAP